MIAQSKKNIYSNQKRSWEFYLAKINGSDSYKTRYFHYLRWKVVLQSIDNILKDKNANKLIALDIGCNRGYYSTYLGEYGVKVDALDVNLDLSKVLSNPNVNYIEKNILDMFPDKKYDLILAFEVYEHLSPNDRGAFIKKINDLLVPGGIFLFSGPNCISLHYGGGYIKSVIGKVLGYSGEIDWHYRIPFYYYNNLFFKQGFENISWFTNGIFLVISNKQECLKKLLPRQCVLNLDSVLSNIFKGFGANYFVVLKKDDTS